MRDPLTIVELRAAKIPVIGYFAWHHWFVVDRAGRRDRWEVWQRRDAGGDSWGHLHRNLMPPERGVGWGGSWIAHRWSGGAANELAQRIEAGPETYPFRGCYWFWPGPNSNTYVQWMLGNSWRLRGRAPGRICARFAVHWTGQRLSIRASPDVRDG